MISVAAGRHDKQCNLEILAHSRADEILAQLMMPAYFAMPDYSSAKQTAHVLLDSIKEIIWLCALLHQMLLSINERQSDACVSACDGLLSGNLACCVL